MEILIFIAFSIMLNEAHNHNHDCHKEVKPIVQNHKGRDIK